MTAPMVRLRLAADLLVDADAWRNEYGTAGLPIDVENYLLSLLIQCPASKAGALSLDGFVVSES